MSRSAKLERREFITIAAIQTAVILVVLVALGFSIRSRVREIYLSSLREPLSDILETVAAELPREVTEDWCMKIAKNRNFRLTVLSSEDGHMFCDTAFKLGTIPSILDRPEVQAAIHSADNRGESLRFSRLISQTERIYSTIYFPERKLVIRAGFTLQSLENNLERFDQMFLAAVFVLAAALAIVLQWTTSGLLFTRASERIGQTEKKIQEDLVANVSHEFRTPLTSIRGFADATLQSIASGQKPNPEFVEIIRKDSDRLLAMVEDLLDLSAIDAGAMQISAEDVDVEEITEQALNRLMMAYRFDPRRIKTHIGIERIFADHDRLLQILINLVGNSLKHSGSETEILIEWTRSGPDSAVLVISDNGSGIPKDIQSKIFQRFARGPDDGSRTRGTGLGLAIVKGLVEAHGATIELDSAAGSGTRFTIRFLTQS